MIPVSTEEYGLSKAARPVNSRLDKSKLVKPDLRFRVGKMLWADI